MLFPPQKNLPFFCIFTPYIYMYILYIYHIWYLRVKNEMKSVHKFINFSLELHPHGMSINQWKGHKVKALLAFDESLIPGFMMENLVNRLDG